MKATGAAQGVCAAAGSCSVRFAWERFATGVLAFVVRLRGGIPKAVEQARPAQGQPTALCRRCVHTLLLGCRAFHSCCHQPSHADLLHLHLPPCGSSDQPSDAMMKAAAQFVEGVRGIEGIEVVGEPEMTVVAFKASAR